MAKNRIFSGKPGRGITYDQWWENYLSPERLEEQAKEREKLRKKQAQNRIYYAKRKEKQAGGRTQGRHERIKYLMQQLEKGDRDRIRKGIYDDSETQIELAEKILVEGDMTDEEISKFKEENDELWYKRNAETLKRRGGLPKPKPPKF